MSDVSSTPIPIPGVSPTEYVYRQTLINGVKRYAKFDVKANNFVKITTSGPNTLAGTLPAGIRVPIGIQSQENYVFPTTQELAKAAELYTATIPKKSSGTQVPNYTEPAGPKSSTRAALAFSAQTQAKIQVLEKNNPPLGKIARELFGGGSTTPQQFIETLQGFDKVTRDRLQSLFAQEIYLNSQAAIAQGGTGLNETAVVDKDGNIINAAGAILNPFGSTEGNRFQGIVDSIDKSVTNTVSRINETFRPVSTEIGQTLGNVSRFTQDPLGTVALIPGSIKNVIERNNKDFAARLEASYKKYNLDDLANAPSLLIGSINGLLSDINDLTALPFIILSDLYQGLTDIINDLADAVQQIVANFVKQIFTNFLDGLILEILDVLQEVSALAGQIMGIATIFGGVTQFTQVLFNTQTYITQLGQFINNPLDLLFAYAPPQVSEALYLLRNPQELVNDILPLQLSEDFAKLSQITGFGFNGNMGYGFVSVIEGLKGGVISSILTNFASQYPILTSLLGILNSNVPPPNTEQPSIVTPSPTAPNNEQVSVNKQGTPTLTQQPKDVVPVKEESSMFADPVAYIRGGIPETPTPQSQARSSGSLQPSVIIRNARAAEADQAARTEAALRPPAPTTQQGTVPTSPTVQARLGPSLTQ